MQRLVKYFAGRYWKIPLSWGATVFSTFSPRFGAALCVGLLSAVIAAADPADGGPYVLSVGDEVSVKVVGAPDLTYSIRVEPDGSVTTPFGDRIVAAGSTLAEVSRAVRAALVGRVFIRRDMPGASFSETVRPDQVAVQIAEYAPIYVTGDVRTQGEWPFRPGLTVRQAIARAGGLSLLSLGESENLATSVALLGDLEMAIGLRARRAALVERLRRELRGEQADDTALDVTSGAGAEAIEARIQADRAIALSQDETALADRIDLIDRHHAQLVARRAAESGALDLDRAVVRRLETSQEVGAVSMNRLSDARRSLLISETRLLQTDSEITRIEVERLTLDQRRGVLRERARAEVLRELAAAEADLEASEIAERSLRRRLGVAGVRDADAPENLRITLRRLNGELEESTPISFATQLSPGDVVDVEILDPLGRPRAEAMSSADPNPRGLVSN